MKKQLQLTFSLAVLCLSQIVWAQNTFTDQRDGKQYKTVSIGGQTWMARNLDYGGENSDIGVCSGNDPKNCQKYGRLYKWEDAMLACPDGWHLPDSDEWQSLINSAGGEIAGRKLKAKSGWEKWNCESTAVDNRGRTTKVNKCNSDNFSFSALPSSNDGQFGFWWTASENYSGATAIIMPHNSEDVRRNGYSKSQALNVRCLKGEKKLPSYLAEKKTALAVAEATKKAEKAAELANPLTTEDTEEGIILRGSTLSKKLAWLNRSAESHNTYIVEVNANENIAPQTLEYKGAINITVVLRGDDKNRIIRLQSHGIMFRIRPNVTLILDNNITLQGHNGNVDCMIWVDGGTLKMNSGSTITGNTRTTTNSSGAGVNVGGTFEMNGGTISGNTAASNGGGVAIYEGSFTMTGGTISGNTAASAGGGVSLRSGTFTMHGGTISGNTATYGGGIFILQGGTFNMSGGTIFGNIANGNGGGIDIDAGSGGTFNMKGGTITGNTAREYGGGVVRKGRGTITKTGGTITGYSSDKSNGNVVKDEEGVIARRGHAIYADENNRKETTTEHSDNLSCSNNGWQSNCTGAWDE